MNTLSVYLKDEIVSNIPKIFQSPLFYSKNWKNISRYNSNMKKTRIIPKNNWKDKPSKFSMFKKSFEIIKDITDGNDLKDEITRKLIKLPNLKEYKEIVKLLLKYGTNPDIRYRNGDTSLAEKDIKK